jgi:RNA polymerase sigma factor (sigma-70 family)
MRLGRRTAKMSAQSDHKTHALLERWANGDDAALSELFPVYFEKVIKLICLDGVPPEDIEEAVQGAFMQLHLWLKRGEKHPERLTAYLLVSARRIIRARSEKLKLPKADPIEAAGVNDNLYASTRSLASSLGSAEIRNRLHEAIERLPGRLREVYQLRMNGLSNREIGTQLGLDAGTVGRYIHDGLELLKRELDRMAREMSVWIRQGKPGKPDPVEVVKALERLPWAYADPVRCRHFEGLADDKGAEKLNVSMEVYQARLKLGYDLLEADLGADFPKAFETMNLGTSP